MPAHILITLPADYKQLREEITQQLAPHADVYVEPSQKTDESSRVYGLDEVKLVIEIAAEAASFVASATGIYETLKRLRDHQKDRTKDVRVGKRDDDDTYLEDAYDGMLELVYTGRLLADPFTPGEGELLRWYLEKYWAWPYEQFAERARLVERLLPEMGQRLYRAVFNDVEPGAVAQINIVTSVPAAMNLPWELLHDGRGFLALRDERPISIARRLAMQGDESSSAKFTPPLRILLVTARPEHVDFIDSRSIARELLSEAQGQDERAKCPPPGIKGIGEGKFRMEELRAPCRLILESR